LYAASYGMQPIRNHFLQPLGARQGGEHPPSTLATLSLLNQQQCPCMGFVESPGLSLEVGHLVVGEGGHICQSFSLLGVPTA
jgi:hypothetical protein